MFVDVFLDSLLLQNKLCFHPAKNHQSFFCYLFSPDTQGDTNLFIFVLGGKTRFQLYKSSGLVGWLSAKGKAKNLGRFDQMTFSLNFGDELSELDQSLIPSCLPLSFMRLRRGLACII